MRLVRRRVVAAVVLPLLLVAGCSGDPKPKFTPPSETPSPTETTTPEPEPEAWEKKTNAGAVAFAKHWIDAFSAAMASEDTEPLRALSRSECDVCEDFADRLDQIHSSGGFYRSKGWSVLEAVPVRGLPEGEALVSMRILEGAAVSREAAGQRVVRTPEVEATWSARLEWGPRGWLISDLRLVQ